ncbi:DMT family transporter [Enterovirga rhinocerotis]|uniref:S-adenosylmethionine uptake transporter n=1 Tax=Enterovirga rhinocerotis TaxID=1339210 RepID=A0A4R7BWX2_9HYPH|nr:DMT family transporter [Enterovirga rhinocerotis]TDR89692.1 S-adenosylmethionine uptake transporter [Enterovirga rhinocerotis]
MSRPVVQAILGIALLSAMDAIIKGAVARLPVLEIAFLRYLVGTAVMIVLLAIERPGWPSREAIVANGLRAVIVVITATSFFYALGQLPLAEVLILSFISPAVTVVFASLILGERIGPRVLASLAAGFAGVALIVWGGLSGGAGDRTSSLLGVAAVLVSAVGYSASNVLLRARAQRDPLVTIVAIQNIGPALILVGPAGWVWLPPSGSLWPALIAIGALGVAGHLLLARAYAAAEAARLAALDYTALIWAVLFGLVVFGEVPTLWAWCGAILIVGSAWTIARR